MMLMFPASISWTGKTQKIQPFLQPNFIQRGDRNDDSTNMLLYKDRNCACAPDRPTTFIRSDEFDGESVRYKETECKQPDKCTHKTFVGICYEK